MALSTGWRSCAVSEAAQYLTLVRLTKDCDSRSRRTLRGEQWAHAPWLTDGLPRGTTPISQHQSGLEVANLGGGHDAWVYHFDDGWRGAWTYGRVREHPDTYRGANARHLLL